jgi:hypothetical protein
MTIILVSTLSLISTAVHAQPLIPVKANAVTYLYGTKASAIDGEAAKQNGNWYKITGPTQLEWALQVSAAGVYEVNITHSVKSAGEGNRVTIVSGNSQITYTLQPTYGAWGIGSHSYERITLNGSLNLKAGGQLITLTVPETATGDPVMKFRCLELIPVAAKATIQADIDAAHRARANTDWFAEEGYGLMFHWTSQSVGRDGSIKPFDQAVADFDLDTYVTMVESTGAGYVLFTIGHAEPYCPAPLASWEKYHPGHTTSRDLIAEMSDALGAKGIKLMCYFPTHVVAKRGQVDSKTFEMINHDVMTEFGQRYGDKVVGYWFDGWSQCFEVYPDVSFPDFFNACKAGYQDRIIALNSWVYPAVTEWQEYWAGENASPVEIPRNGTYERGPGAGLQFQSLLIMEPYWVQQRAEMPDPRFTVDKLSTYIEDCMKNGGVVTINLGIYQDGTVGEKALEVMKGVRQRIRE